MAIRVQSQTNFDFGTPDANIDISHIRFRKSVTDQVIVELANVVTGEVNKPLRIPSAMFDIVYPSGPLGNAHMSAVISPYWDGESLMIDLMTDGSTIVSSSWYSQISHDGWAITEEAD